MMYGSSAQVRQDVSRMARPPKRVSISDSVEGRMKLPTGGGNSQLWQSDLSPYMLRPMNLLTSREYKSVVFVGPARGSKTAALLAWVHYTIEIDPADMMIVHMTQQTSSDFSKTELRRLLKDNAHLKKHLSTNKQDNNTHDKHFRAGNVLYVGWPTASQGSGKTLARVALTDYDRMPEDIDKRGTPFDIFSKRTQTLMSRGMTYLETSPDYEIIDPTYQTKTPHEAPPTLGALSIYNTGTRERLYYKCPHCGDWFITPWDYTGFNYIHNRDQSGITIAENFGPVQLICSANGCLIDQTHKRQMNRSSIWVPDGCEIHNGEVCGEAPKSEIASFWMHGCSAAYQTWESIVERRLQADRAYDLTGSEQSLKARCNVDMGAPYLSRLKQVTHSSKDLERRAEDTLKRHVPRGTRYIITSIDVQGGHFVVQVVGHGVGNERWLIDRYSISKSRRKNGLGEYMPMAPGSYLEDWEEISAIMDKKYPLMDGSDRYMGSRLVMCDSGGKGATTANAYNYWRLLKRSGQAAEFNRRNASLIRGKFVLLKGEKTKRFQNQIGELKYPDTIYSNRKYAVAHGDVPLWLINVNQIKDVLSGDLERDEEGPRYIHFPDWLSSDFYEELTAESRNAAGRWVPFKPGARNESLDLLVYDEAGNAILGGNKINWDNPPGWAMDWDENSIVFASESQKDKQAKVKPAEQTYWPAPMVSDDPLLR